MKRFLLVGVVALLLPGAALAKGPSEARLDGLGLEGGLALPNLGEEGGVLAQTAGFFPAVFGQTPSPMVQRRPKGDLGPRYTITYTVPGPSGDSTIRQDLYPYADPLPVTYLKPGQTFWDGQKTAGGWYLAGMALKQALVRAGLPQNEPAVQESGFSAAALIGIPLGIAAALGLAAFATVGLRRRRRTQTAS